MDGAKIELIDSVYADNVMQTYLKSEIIIGDVNVRESIENLKATLEPVTTTLSGYVKEVVESAYPNADTKEY